MKGFISTALLGASSVAAFPSLKLENNAAAQHEVNIGKRQVLSGPQGAGALPLVPPPFDAKSQYVSNQGAHAVRIDMIY